MQNRILTLLNLACFTNKKWLKLIYLNLLGAVNCLHSIVEFMSWDLGMLSERLRLLASREPLGGCPEPPQVGPEIGLGGRYWVASPWCQHRKMLAGQQPKVSKLPKFHYAPCNLFANIAADIMKTCSVISVHNSWAMHCS